MPAAAGAAPTHSYHKISASVGLRGHPLRVSQSVITLLCLTLISTSPQHNRGQFLQLVGTRTLSQVIYELTFENKSLASGSMFCEVEEILHPYYADPTRSVWAKARNMEGMGSRDLEGEGVGISHAIHAPPPEYPCGLTRASLEYAGRAYEPALRCGETRRKLKRIRNSLT